jgi:hypothetical protein
MVEHASSAAARTAAAAIEIPAIELPPAEQLVLMPLMLGAVALIGIVAGPGA